MLDLGNYNLVSVRVGWCREHARLLRRRAASALGCGAGNQLATVGDT